MEAVTKTTKTIEEIIGGAYCPLPINVIPNNIGINLVSVESISWTKQEDGQLVSLTINFLPNTLTTMEKKQTAVEWYANASHELIVKKNNGEITNTDFLITHHNLFYEAQKMEKEQIISANIDLINSKLANLIGGETCTMKAEVRILTDNIIALREWADEEDDEINPDMCAVYLTSGEFFILYKPYAEVVEILEWY